MLPFKQKKVNNRIIREFAKDTNTEELVWHRDHKDRTVKIIEGKGWLLQIDNQTPFLLESKKQYFIPKNTYHRIIKGSSKLILELDENNLVIRNKIRQILKEAMKSPNSLGDDFAVWTNWYEDNSPPPGTELNFILYNTVGAGMGHIEPLMNAAEGEGIDDYEIVEAIGSQVYAVIRARVPDAGYGECNSAWEVIRSAAEKGYGPTLYDLVMSIAPNGLTSDRSEVSASAKKVWSHYANNRSSIDKKLLDPEGGYTATEEDDCQVQGNGSAWDRSPLPALHRQMAIDFFEEYYSVEHEEWMEDQDPQHIDYLRHVDGDEYFEEVTKWIEANQDENLYEDWDPDNASDEWYAWKDENELNLIDNIEGEITDPHQLNMSYNTDYAVNAMNDLIGNHFNWISKLEDTAGYTSGIDEEHLTFAVRDFFKEKYR